MNYPDLRPSRRLLRLNLQLQNRSLLEFEASQTCTSVGPCPSSFGPRHPLQASDVTSLGVWWAPCSSRGSSAVLSGPLPPTASAWSTLLRLSGGEIVYWKLGSALQLRMVSPSWEDEAADAEACDGVCEAQQPQEQVLLESRALVRIS